MDRRTFISRLALGTLAVPRAGPAQPARKVVTLRFGLEGEEAMTLESIGHRLGVTRERVRQIEAAALKQLRALLAARDVKSSDTI